jgi:SAM-dependent methyltransferase
MEPFTPRTPRSKIYDGAFYGRVLEPLLGGLHGFVADHLPPGDRVLDACCGSGGLSRRLAQAGRRVTGVELSPAHVQHARRRARAAGLSESRLRFELGDVAELPVPPEGLFDVAVIVLALHEMPADARAPVLRRLTDVAHQVAVLDFAAPMPWNVPGARNRLAELLAGPEHFAAFRDYQRRGGLPRIAADAGQSIATTRFVDGATLVFTMLEGCGAPVEPTDGGRRG